MLQFNFTYDPGISLEQRVAFELAARIWGTYLTDDITVNLHIVSAETLEGDAIGGAVPIFHEQNYGVLNEYLEQDAAASDDPNAPSIDEQVVDALQEGNTVDVLIDGEVVDGNSDVLLTSAQAKALGMDEAIALDNGTTWDRNLVDANALDGYIVINQSYDWSYDFHRTSPAEGKTLDFLSLALHEIGHQLGFVSGLDGMLDLNQLYSGETQVDGFTLLDLFRHTADSQSVSNPDGSVSDLTVGADAVFSVNGGADGLAMFSTGQRGDGFQAAHWKRMNRALGIMDPTLAYKERLKITELDAQALDALGYDVNYDAFNSQLDISSLLLEAEIAVAEQMGLDGSVLAATRSNGYPEGEYELNFAQWWQIFEAQIVELGYGNWWQLLELGHAFWTQQFDAAVVDQDYGSWWQQFEAVVVELGYGEWWQQFEATVVDLDYGSWWQVFEAAIVDLGYGSWFQQFEAALVDLGYGSWWQILEQGYGNWWQQVETFFATLERVDDATDQASFVAGGGVANGETIVFRGGADDDIIGGNEKQDRINGENGDDLIDGKAGHDVLWGEAGNDLIYGQDGNDLIYGGNDDDLLLGEAGDDELHGEAGHDVANGGRGDDIVTGGDGRDDLEGGAGRDVLSGDAGNDRLEGGADNDVVIGGEGRDQVKGGAGHDLLYGDTYLGEETLKQLRALLKQEPVETNSNTPVEVPVNNGLNPIRVEAEGMTLSGDYAIRTTWNNDSGDTLRVFSNATATTTFSGPSGNYMVVARYFDEDENGDYAALDFTLNGSNLNQFVLDQETDQYHTRTVAQNLALNTGDVFTVTGTVEGEDNVNLDYLEFVSLNNLIVTQLEPLSAENIVNTDNNVLRIEAESMSLLGDYSAASYSFGSGGSLIELSNQGQGKALTTFNGETGYYNILVGYHDENDNGIGQITARLDGVELDSWLLNQNLATAEVSADNFTTRTVATGIALSTGDVFELSGLRGESDVTDEATRIDYVEFIKVDAPTVAQAPTPEVSATPEVSVETTHDPDLVAHWTFDDASGLVATSETGRHNGTLKNTVTNDSQWIVGEAGNALKLDGVNDYVAIADSSEINTGIHGQRTISLWFKADDTTIANRKQVLYEEGGSTRGLSIYLHDEKLYVGGWNYGANQSGWTGTFLHTNTISSDQWHHVALVLNGNQQVRNGALTAYLDGEKFGDGVGSQLWSHSDNVALGAVNEGVRFHDGVASGSGTHAFAGSLDDARIYNRALSTDEIGILVGQDNDLIQGGTGEDIAFGGEGNDVIYGESQRDHSSVTLAGSHTYRGHTYLLSSLGTWENAQAEARSLGGNLVTINDEAEEAWLQNTFGTVGELWIGLTDKAVEGQFEWVSGEAVTYTNWSPNEPNDYGSGEDYGILNRSGTQQWDDRGQPGQVYRGVIEIKKTDNDTLFGDTGNDNIYGQAGNDALYGDGLNTALSEGLVVRWTFDEGIGNTTAETAGQTNNTGLLWGTVIWTEGVLGGAIDLSSEGSVISTSDAAELDITRQLTLSTWVKADQFRDGDGLIAKGDDQNESYGLKLWSDGSLRFSANLNALDSSSGSHWNSNTKLSLDAWHHVAATYDGEALRFYIDGQLDSNVVYTDLQFETHDEDLIVGASLHGADEFFDGALDDVRVYNRALSDVELAALSTGDNLQPHALPQFMHLLDDGNDDLALYEETLQSDGTFSKSLINSDTNFRDVTVGIATADGLHFYQLFNDGVGSNKLYEATRWDNGIFEWVLRSDDSNLSGTLGFATADGQTFYQLVDDGVGTAALYEADLQADGTFNSTLLNADSGIERSALSLSTVDGKTFYHLQDDGSGSASSWQSTLQSNGTFFNTLLSDDSNIDRHTLGQVAWDPNALPQFMHLFDDGNDNLAVYEETPLDDGTLNTNLVNVDSGFNNSTVGIASADGQVFYQLLDYTYMGRSSNTLYEVTMDESGVFNWTLRSDESNLSDTLGLATADGQTFYQLVDDGVGSAALYEATLQADGTFTSILLNADSGIGRSALSLSTVDGKNFYHLRDDGSGSAARLHSTLQSDGTFFNTLLSSDSDIGSSTLGQGAWDANAHLNEQNDNPLTEGVGSNVSGTDADHLIGGVGNDTLIGGLGDDVLNGTDAVAAGNFEKDTLSGGAGGDTFILGDATQAYYQTHGDQDYALIKDFVEGEDTLQLQGSAGAYTQSAIGNDLHLYYGGTELIAILENVSSVNLTGASVSYW